MDYSELRNYQVDNIETLFYANKNLRDVFLEVEDFASELHLTVLLAPEPIDDLVPNS